MTASAKRDKCEPLAPPWASRAAWQAINEAMAFALERRRHMLTELSAWARRIHGRVEALGPLMDALCEATCASCYDNCCNRATVWFDFKDLLCLHLGDISLPPGQLISASGRPCRYGSLSGCTLPRAGRPFVCTWFICGAQKRVLDRCAVSRKAFLRNSLTALKKGREHLENMFTQIVTSP